MNDRLPPKQGHVTSLSFEKQVIISRKRCKMDMVATVV